jgi:hypothetical protein
MTEANDRSALGAEIGEILGQIVEQAAPVRSQFADRIFPVDYNDLVARPAETVCQLHERMGRPVDASMPSRIESWLGENPQHKYGRHLYTAEEFGLDPQEWQRQHGDAYDVLFAAR